MERWVDERVVEILRFAQDTALDFVGSQGK
jgi:hypothetical protein